MSFWFKSVLALLALIFLVCLWPRSLIWAQTDSATAEGVISQVLKERVEILNEDKQVFQELEVYINQGESKEQTVKVQTESLVTVDNRRYRVGERVMLLKQEDFAGNPEWVITDYIRRDSLFWLLIIFVVLVLVVARWKGLASMLGMLFSFLVIYWLVLPQVMAGANPILVAVGAALVIILVSFYLAHGLTRKTTSAIIGTLIALIISALLSLLFVDLAKISGFASEEMSFLFVARQGAINVRGLLLAGIIVALLGVLDDVTISQAAIVFKLKQTNPLLKPRLLYTQAMDVGRDHIASMVNTLVLVYVGSSLPLLLLFMDNPQPFATVINYEIIAEEVIRTLVTSIGLILAVPITTVIAALMAEKDR